MRKLAIILLSLSVTGCRSHPFPSSVQPAELDVYHAYILHYAETHPRDVQQIYINQTASGGTFLVGDGGDPKGRQTYDECLTPKAHAAFLALHETQNSLGEVAASGWRTLADGRVLSLTNAPSDPKVPQTSITFSRVFLAADGKNAYMNTVVNKCNGACGGASMIWHVIRDGYSWKFNPTKCYLLH